MPTENANDDFNDELLSAYVDGELTAHERALVEARLRTDPQAAQTVEELRSLSSALRSLPRETLGHDLRDRIRAEVDRAKADLDIRNALPMTPPVDRGAGFRRGLVWSAIAIAATLMLAVTQPEQPDQGRQVAEVDRQKSKRVADKGPRSMGTMRALGAPEGAPESESDFAKDMSAAPAATSGTLQFDRRSSETTPSQTYDGSELKRESLRRNFARGLSEAEDSIPSTAEPRGMDELAAEAPRQSGQAGAAAGVIEPSVGGGGASFETRSASGAPNADEPETIELAVTAPDGIARFEKLLAESDIQLEVTSEEDATKKVDLSAKALEPQGAVSGDEPAPLAESAIAWKAEGTATEQVTEQVLVEASPEQINQLVMSCAADKDAFAFVSPPIDGKLAHADRQSRWHFSGGFGGERGGQAAEQRAGSSPTPAREADSTDLTPLAKQAPADPAQRQAAADEQSGPEWNISGRLGGEIVPGRAWRVPAAERGAAALASPLDLGLKEKEKLAERKRSVDALDRADPPLAPAITLHDEKAARLGAQSFANAPQSGRMRVLFVLRSVPAATRAPAAPQPSEPANAKQ